MRAVTWLASPRVLLRTYGARGLWRRGLHELRRAVGGFKVRPGGEYANADRRAGAYRLLGHASGLGAANLARHIERGRKVVGGRYEAYGHAWRELPSSAAQWRTHPSTSFEFPLTQWWKVPLLPRGADIKDVWEPGRFGWAYDLIRAHAATRDRRYAIAFHRLLAAWQCANPPFTGPQWACGQETAIRALAILHAEDNFAADTDEANRIVSVLCWSGERIADAIGYGLSQRNNHGISEAAGLIHLGLRLSGMHRDASRWVESGVRLLDEQICDQFAADGWYAQHSFTYLRVALEQALYAQRALVSVGRTLSNAALARLDAAADLLVAVIDAHTGTVPNHGANDGARVLPLSSAAYRDFRPVLTLAAIVRNRPLPADVELDAEVIHWLGQAPPTVGPPRADGVLSARSGFVVARAFGWTIFLRAAHYGHRPSHLDSLHMDVAADGHEIVVDAGTYAYNAAAPWRNALVTSAVHNGPVVDDREQAERGPHFLWLSWPRARVVLVEHGPSMARIVAERPRIARREVTITQQEVRVVDRALGPNAESVQVTWLLHPDLAGSAPVVAEGARALVANEGDVTAWFSPTYGLREPTRAIRIRREGKAARDAVETRIRRATFAPIGEAS